jgi:hypothetical protein
MNESPLSEFEIKRLLSLLKREADVTHIMRRCWPFLNVLQYISLAFYFIAFFRWPSYRPLWDRIFYPIFAGYGGIAFWCYLRQRLGKKALATLARGKDVRLLGPLYDIFWFTEASQREEIESCLLSLLPLITSTECPALTEQQKMGLYSTLYWSNASLVLQTLPVLEPLADRHCLSYVEALAEGQYLAAERSDIAAAASNLLPVLRKRFAQQEFVEVLLRPAQTENSPAVLLRPANAVSEPDSGLLLRPAEPGSKES